MSLQPPGRAHMDVDGAALEGAIGALDHLKIEIPSWGFANTGTRFGKFIQPAAATSIEDKFSDAAEVHKLTGVAPSVALHIQWDMPNGLSDVPKLKELEVAHGVKAG